MEVAKGVGCWMEEEGRPLTGRRKGRRRRSCYNTSLARKRRRRWRKEVYRVTTTHESEFGSGRSRLFPTRKRKNVFQPRLWCQTEETIPTTRTTTYKLPSSGGRRRENTKRKTFLEDKKKPPLWDKERKGPSESLFPWSPSANLSFFFSFSFSPRHLIRPLIE